MIIASGAKQSIFRMTAKQKMDCFGGSAASQ
jgi:hypothetical protein